MQLSARNALKGKVVEISRGQIVGKVKVDVGGQFVTSLVSVEAIDELGLKVGEEVSAIIKSTEVMLAK
ncbi:TOBE domain-containing protein [Magnetospirillum gryphiswaldense]|jgi:molybdopterin-binding protein|uniref:Molybdenum-pterin binding protein n=2 Tax=Magnetospirillum gryphiswaldense TaxID=55518 RepID=A4TYH6_9PROT|nr:TOBE domain-containing protein [Magnetospirillum gryphiswaldense]AVM75080.1 Molybdenum-pterin-binding protein 2 [Magnetospirillum gryphiswaldense MSR-1]AVM78983.1 Molybdenum-pterin-binding protein 2 [Magnetospirillum gryphiswaldense]CAM75683.1 Molybdenum-pterin binding protein [Magnetospirillum gryphiswaldense MSR-1]CDL01030.1 Molybdenum-pterin binding protein (Mop); putative molybdenum transport component [Magnetospirillum gryphiswaldense MSR-1 v2]